MTAKKKKSKPKKKLMIDDLLVGDVIYDLHNEEIEITDDLIEQMRQYEQETKKSAIWRNAITGSFLFWQMPKNNKKAEVTKKILKQAIEDVTELEQEVIDEENLLKDAMEDYRMEFNVKTVNTNTKKFKAFFEEWKSSN